MQGSLSILLLGRVIFFMERPIIRRKLILITSWSVNLIFLLIFLSGFGICSNNISSLDFCPPLNPGPPLPAAGGNFVDPIFGSEIIRVTDKSDGKNANTAYSYWNLFNCDSTKFFISIDQRVTLYKIDKNTDSITKVGSLFPGDPKLAFEGIIWSSKGADVLYGLSGARIYQYNTVTKKYRVIKDFSSIWPGTYLWQMSMSEDESVFAFTVKRGSDYSNLGIGWYRVSSDTYDRWDMPTVDECQVDKGGNYIYVHKGKGGVVWDINTSRKINLDWNRTDHPMSHYDQGYGKILGGDPWAHKGYTYTIRSLSNPKNHKIVFVGDNWRVNQHISWRNNDEQYAYSSNYTDDGLTKAPLENEIIQIFLDGSKRFRRLAHHRSIYKIYEDSPRACVDRLGKYVVFTSNWDNSGRRDVFILKIPNAFQFSGSRK